MKPLKIRILLVVLAVLLTASAALAADGWLGVTMQELSTNLAKAMDLENADGVLVSSVVAESPAAKAGLEDGDVIVAFGESAIKSPDDLSRAVAKTSPGDKVKVRVMRGGKAKSVNVTVGEREESDDDNPMLRWFDDTGHQRMIIRNLHNGGYLGVGLQDLTDQLGEVFGVKDGKGALVTEIADDAPAAKSDLKAGDIIVTFGDETIGDSDDLRDAVMDRKPGDEVKVTYVRQGKTKTTTVTVGERPEGDDAMYSVHRMLRKLPRALQFMPRNDAHLRAWHNRGDNAVARIQEEKELQELREDLQDLRTQLDALQKELKSR